MLSVHVFAVADDLKSDEGESDGDVLDAAMRYYVVALQKDGRTMLVWHVTLTGDGYVAEVHGQLGVCSVYCLYSFPPPCIFAFFTRIF